MVGLLSYRLGFQNKLHHKQRCNLNAKANAGEREPRHGSFRRISHGRVLPSTRMWLISEEGYLWETFLQSKRLAININK